MKTKLCMIAAIALVCVGCNFAKATKTTTTSNGVTTTDSINVKSFLATLHNGAYSNGNGMVLTVTDATPDQASIATLSGGLVELGKAALLLAQKPATNAPGTNALTTPK